MTVVLITALGVGGATLLGAIIGFAFKSISHKFSDVILSFAAGIMLCAAFSGLIIPSIEYGGEFAPLVTSAGIFCGAVVLHLIDKLVPHLHRMVGKDTEEHSKRNDRFNKVLLFVIAIAIHNLPEGVAAGVGFGTKNIADAATIALGIALQNVPEGMVIISLMMTVGMSKTKAFFIAALTGFVEVIGTFLGYFAVNISNAVLPFAMAFAGGTMLYIISDEMIPETHHDNSCYATYALLAGFCLMLIMDFYIG